MPRGKLKPYHKHFRFKKVGGYFYVIYRVDPAHPRSTGIRVEEGESAAVNWAYANMYMKLDSSIVLGEFAKDFFDPEKCSWTRRMLRKNRTFAANYLPANRARLHNYVLPRFGSVPLHMISTKLLDEWLLDLDSISTGMPLSPSSLDKILNVMRKILGEAKYQGHLQENVACEITPFEVRGEKRRNPFTMQEIRLLFPDNFERNMQIWLTLEWYAFFLLQWTCGLRPGEVAAFMLSDWIKEHHGAIISRSVENSILQVKGLKTTNRGMAVKPVVFSDRLEKTLGMLEFRGTPKDDLLFRSPNNKPIGLNTSNKHFKASVNRAGIDLKDRTQYCLRHTFYTEALKRLPEKEVEKMAGHRSLRKEYDHRKGIDFLKAAAPLRDVINSLSA